MAENITMKQVPGGTVTAKDDRILNDSNIADSGIIYGCDISYTGNNMIHINAGFGIIKGGLFEIDDHTEYIELPVSGTRAGQIYLHLDLSADDKLQIIKDTASPLHEMVQNADANFVNGIYEFQLCTFTATATALQDVTATFAVVSNQVLDTKEEIMANTTPGLKAGALPVKQLFDSLTASDNLQFRFATDGEGNHGYLGADDSFIPFKGDREVFLQLPVSHNNPIKYDNSDAIVRLQESSSTKKISIRGDMYVALTWFANAKGSATTVINNASRKYKKMKIKWLYQKDVNNAWDYIMHIKANGQVLYPIEKKDMDLSDVATIDISSYDSIELKVEAVYGAACVMYIVVDCF